MSPGLESTIEEAGGMLRVRVTAPRNHHSLTGDEVVKAPVTVATVELRADEDTAKAVGDALLSWYADQQDPTYPGPKSVTQRMDEVYNR